MKAVEQIDMPEGIEWEVGGARESDSDTLNMIVSGLVIAVVIIFFILLFHFRRINMALLILGSLALCLLGAGVGIWVMGLDVSVTAVLGIVSLMGILVRNGIIMLDYADELRMKEGLSVREAALHSAKQGLSGYSLATIFSPFLSYRATFLRGNEITSTGCSPSIHFTDMPSKIEAC